MIYNIKKIANLNKLWIFLIFCSLIIIYHQFGYLGHFGYDDLHYAELSKNLTEGEIDFNDHSSYRWTILGLTSLSYQLFGINDFASSLPAIIITISILFIIYLILKNKKLPVLIFGLALFTLNHWTIFYSDKLMPDVYVTFSAVLSLFIIYHYKFKRIKNRTIIYSLLFSISILLGFLSKGTIVLILPLIFILFIIDILQKRNINFWLFSIILTFLIFSGYLLIIKSLTGDALIRFKAIMENSYLNLCSYDNQPIIFTLKRISYELLLDFINQGMFTGATLFFTAIFYIRFKNILKVHNEYSFFFITTLVLLISSNFMTVSMKSYVPMCIDPRHYLFIIPFTSIFGAFVLNDYIENKTNKIPVLFIWLIVTIISIIFTKSDTFWEIYIPVLCLFLLRFFLPDKVGKWKWAFIIAFVIILMIKPLNMLTYSQKVNYDKQKLIVKKYFIDNQSECYVLTNEVQKRLGDYYNGFNAKSNCTFLNYKEVEQFTFPDNYDKYLLLNWYTRYLSNLNYNDLPYYAKIIDTSYYEIFKDEKLDISIYKVENFKKTKKILISQNNFENYVDNWEINKSDLVNNISYQGNYSYKVDEFSATFKLQIDSIKPVLTGKILIRGYLYCFFKDITSAKLVFSLESNGKPYYWEGIEVKKYIKSYGSWWPVSIDNNIDSKDIQENSILKVYLWNPDKKETYIDNFSVGIYVIQ